MKSDIVNIDEQSLLTALKPPASFFFSSMFSSNSENCKQLPRQILDVAVQWAMKAEKSKFWRGGTRKSNKVESSRENMMTMRKGAANTITRTKSEEFV